MTEETNRMVSARLAKMIFGAYARFVPMHQASVASHLPLFCLPFLVSVDHYMIFAGCWRELVLDNAHELFLF